MKKIITLLLALAGMVSTASATTMYILGTNPELGSWDPSNPKTMTKASDGTYYYKFTATAYSGNDNAHYFCFSTAKGANSGDWDTFNASAYRPSSDKSVSFGQPCTESVNSSNSKSFYISLTSGTEYIIAFDPTAPRIAVTYAPSKIYVLGGADGWAANSGITMEASSDYIYSCNLPVNTTINTFAFTTQLGSSDDDWSGISDYRFGAQSSSGNYEISTFPNANINLGWGSDNNHSFKIASVGTYKLVMDYKLLKLSVYATESVTTNSNGYCTYVNTNPLTIEGASAYYATDRGNGSATAVAMTNPAADTPMLIKGDNSKTYYFAVTSSGTDFSSTNAFHAGPVTGLESNPSVGVYNYILNGEVFKAANGMNVGEGKAYLQLSAPAAARVLIFEDEITGINAITNNNNRSEAYYNLSGQRVAQPSKGMYIVNGKKVIY